MRRIAIATHVATIDGKQYDGIGDTLRESLDGLGCEYLFVRHSIDGLINSEVRKYHNAEVAKTNALRVIRRPSPLRYLSELLSTVLYFTFKEKVAVYLGVDPLNALAGIFLRTIGRVERAIFYTADYSPTRFNNKWLDAIYHWVDRFSVKHADEVWSVSSRIVEVRKGMGLHKDKNILVPNVPPLSYAAKVDKKRNKYKLVTLGIIDKQLDFEGIILAVKELKHEYPDISLVIIGNGPEEARLKQLVKNNRLSERVKFTGRLPFSDAQELVASSGVGLALYTGIWGFNAYGDSTKCREYFTYGLPVLSTDTHSTVEDIKEFEAGIIVDVSVAHYVSALKELFTHYDKYSKNSLKLGARYEGIREKELSRILSN